MNTTSEISDNFKSSFDSGFLVKRFKSYPAVNSIEKEILRSLAQDYVKKNQINLAIKLYEKALLIDPIDSALILQLSSMKLSGPNYLDVLKSAHELYKPKTYIEIGVCKGISLNLADETTVSIGIDPEPQLDISLLPKNHKVVKDTSDNYFKNGHCEEDLHDESFDMAFLDGMHLFEFALRDFINLEKYSHKNSVIFIHDLYPMNAETSTRERNSDFWSGDVWKLVLCLTEYRPDLSLKVLPCPPTGLGMVKNLDSTSKVLEDNYDIILNKFVNMSYDVLDKDKKLKLVSVAETNQLFI